MTAHTDMAAVSHVSTNLKYAASVEGGTTYTRGVFSYMHACTMLALWVVFLVHHVLPAWNE